MVNIIADSLLGLGCVRVVKRQETMTFLPLKMNLATLNMYLTLKPLKTPSSSEWSRTLRPVAPRLDSTGPGAVTSQYRPRRKPHALD
ncbi:Hypothetical predicted protein [Cloeon dipterum]|uniref:Uncharacterized protein n=1 Tax=Cloeon dipterum TaxID=197152 RepID=A0A8S1DU72_9INSE|nr:Hypothetical predicted protein [Cloeon dipterum]